MSYRRKIIAGNWKMNKTSKEAKNLVEELIGELGKFSDSDVEIIICPPFTSLEASAHALEGSSAIILGAQNVHTEKSGAYTGEVSVEMLRDIYCRYVIVGHSERRQYNQESDDAINQKARAALAGGLRPIICVGESLKERESGKTETVVKTQIEASAANFSETEWADIVIAYEPVWAIGTGKTATPDQAEEVHLLIRNTIAAMTNTTVAEKVRIQYGGSVKPDNAEKLLSQPNIDGALVGGASLQANSFASIIEAACREA